jgi:hypothetical protein
VNRRGEKSLTSFTVEDPIRDMRSLRRWLRNLEEDEGLRIVGRAEAFAGGGFMFVGHRQGKYRINICDRIWDRKLRTYRAGGGGLWREFDSFEEAWGYVRPLVRRPVQAWVY